MVNHDDFVVADIPGLIEGAHMGVGLGHSFLRHVQRTRLLVHLLDGMSEDPVADYNQINAELSLFDERLAERQQIVVYTKMDIPEVQEKWPSVQESLAERGVEAMAISAVTHENVQTLIHTMFETLATVPRVIPKEKPTMTVYELPEEEISFEIEMLEDGVYEVSGEQIERAALMTYWDYEEAIKRFQKTLNALGIYDALKDAGVQQGDTVIIGNNELEWHD
jgi:GTP-binding protein